MSDGNIKFRISVVENQLKELNTELKKVCHNPMSQSKVIEKIRLKQGELIGLNFALK